MSAVDRARAAEVLPAGHWVVDEARSSVTFAVKHMLFSTVRGSFGEFEGTLDLDESSA